MHSSKPRDDHAPKQHAVMLQRSAASIGHGHPNARPLTTVPLDAGLNVDSCKEFHTFAFIRHQPVARPSECG